MDETYVSVTDMNTTGIDMSSLQPNGSSNLSSVQMQSREARHLQEQDRMNGDAQGRSVFLPTPIIDAKAPKDTTRIHRERTMDEAKLPTHMRNASGNATPTSAIVNKSTVAQTPAVPESGIMEFDFGQQRRPSSAGVKPAPKTESKLKWDKIPLYEPKRPGVPYSSCDREICHFQIGGAGNNFSHEFWRELCDEHGIWWDKHDQFASCHAQFYQDDSKLYKLQQVSTMFYESSTGRYVPRAILMDLDSKFVDALVGTPLGRMYNPNNIIYNDAGAGNLFATARNVTGGPLVDSAMEVLFQEVEKMDSLQGFTIGHSLGGGTGSGLTAGVLDGIDVHFGRSAFVQTYSLAIKAMVSDSVVQPYNAILGLESQIEFADQCLWFDNFALNKICMQVQQIRTPEFIHNDTILAKILAGITSNLRFPGSMDADLRKMNTNLVPFPECKFLIGGAAPVTSAHSAAYKKTSVMDLGLQMLREDNCVLSCNPLRKALDRDSEDPFVANDSLFLGLFGAWRGKKDLVAPSEIEECMKRLQQDVPGYREHFPDWIPNLISSSICSEMGVGEADHDVTLSYMANTTAIMESLDSTLHQFDSFFKVAAYTHAQEAHGVSKDDLVEAREKCLQLFDLYGQKLVRGADPVSRWVDGDEPDHFTEEQRQIVQKIRDLSAPHGIEHISPTLLRASIRGNTIQAGNTTMTSLRDSGIAPRPLSGMRTSDRFLYTQNPKMRPRDKINALLNETNAAGAYTNNGQSQAFRSTVHSQQQQAPNGNDGTFRGSRGALIASYNQPQQQ